MNASVTSFREVCREYANDRGMAFKMHLLVDIMSLKVYRKKRDFKKTAEPAGASTASRRPNLRFVVQKHAARRLHYDFRLELDGTLKSWAIPKGPSLNPDDKRLAVQVEDHPIEYRTFEGTIPAGEYGGGTVMVWDEGTFKDPSAKTRAEGERRLLAGLQKGHLSFVMEGKKLRGEFSLVRMPRAGEKNWLLIKKHDADATDAEAFDDTTSSKTGRTLNEIKAGAAERGDVWRSGAGREPRKPKPKKAKPAFLVRSVDTGDPDLVKPMLATLIDAPFDRKDWLFEIKWDGYRAIAHTGPKGVMLYSRNHNSFNEKYRPVLEDLAKIKLPVVLDGEIVVLDAEGRSSFQLLQQYNETGRGNLAYYAFDILRFKGKDLTDLPLRERKKMLARMIPKAGRIHLSEHIEEAGTAFFAAAVEKNLEGLIAKNAESVYWEGKRSTEWLKVKTSLRQEALICGYTDPRGGRTKFGALILGVYDDKKLTYIGHTGTGFSESTLHSLHKKFQPLIRTECPFKVRPQTNQQPTWLIPRLICEVAFQEWTADGAMRHPIFLGLRADKAPKQVRREEARKPTPKLLGADRDAPKNAASPVKLTHLGKVLWPDDKITKGDLIEYYRAVAPHILPYLKDRPQSLHRFPNGITAPGFYQKNADAALPDWVETVLETSGEGREIRYVICQNEATLLYLANLGCIELNPWNSRVGQADRPDYFVIDLDPEAIGFPKVIETALEVRRLFDSIEVESFCKTSGATGLHIYVPVAARYEVDAVRQFAEIVANVVHERIPKISSVVRSPRDRQRKVYLDYLQNRKHQTLASVYSVRPRPGATVSTPLLWKEVKPGLDPGAFTMRTVLRRIEKLGDLFRGVLGEGIDLNHCLEKLQKAAR